MFVIIRKYSLFNLSEKIQNYIIDMIHIYVYYVYVCVYICIYVIYRENLGMVLSSSLYISPQFVNNKHRNRKNIISFESKQTLHLSIDIIPLNK